MMAVGITSFATIMVKKNGLENIKKTQKMEKFSSERPEELNGFDTPEFFRTNLNNYEGQFLFGYIRHS